MSPMIVRRAMRVGKLAEFESFAGIGPEDLEVTIIEQSVVSSVVHTIWRHANTIITLTFYRPDP